MMKVFFLSLVFALTTMIGYAQLTDDFSDGDIDFNPMWIGDTGKFVVNPSAVLQSNGSQINADTLNLSSLSSLINKTEWHFYMQLDFNPTATGNYVKVYLVSDQSNLEGSLNGYFIRIGETGNSDTLELYRQTGTTETKIFTGSIAYGSTTKAGIKVTRDSLGNWTMYSDPTGGVDYLFEGNGFDNTHLSTNYFGVYCKYSTLSRFDQFLFDDIYVGTIIADTIAPGISAVSVTSDTTIDVLFDEKVTQSTAELLANYSADNGLGNPSTANIDGLDSSIVHLEFATAFGNGILNTLAVSNIADNSGNIMANPVSKTFTYFLAETAEVFDIVINEIFADPSPSVGLPEKEFIELYNKSNKVINLAGYTYSDASSSATITGGFIVPGGYLILCANADTNYYKPFGNVLGLTSWPSLNNTGDNLRLRTSTGLLMHTVEYSDTWYNNPFKESGGWSLEMKDPNNPCAESGNWGASVAFLGGSPGTENTVFGTNPDNKAPALRRADGIDSMNVLLTFSEPLDSLSASSASYTINNGISVLLDSVMSSKTVKLTLGNALQQQVLYTITVSGAMDCVGNLLGAENTAVFALPEQGLPGDLIINEILSNPIESGSDFIEVYNNSNRYIDLNGWQLAKMGIDTIDGFESISSNPYVVFPGDYVMLSKDTANIKEVYPKANSSSFLQLGGFPTYNNDEGTVILVNNLLEVSDSISYDVSMHFSLLNDENGVSLERMDFDRPAYEKTNWHSAAEAVGFATPGYKNSQFNQGDAVDDGIIVIPEIFSPDNDGIDDVVDINYEFDVPGFVGSIYIYDSKGRLLKSLVQNDLLGTSGTFSWDGTIDNGEKARIGIYIIFFEAFGIGGEVRKFKRTCVLAGKL